MTLDEAIKHAEEVAEEKEDEAQDLEYSRLDWRHEANQCLECAKEHRQLAEWLKDYKRLLEQEPVLDKIRAEIVDLGRRTMNDNRASGIWACRDIIDKYKAEMEVEE